MGPFELTTKPEDYVFSDTLRFAEENREINFAQNAQPVTLVRLSDIKSPSLWGRTQARLRNSKSTASILTKPKLANTPMDRKSPENGSLHSDSLTEKDISPPLS